jgi:hypothetical protein
MVFELFVYVNRPFNLSSAMLPLPLFISDWLAQADSTTMNNIYLKYINFQ